MGPGRGREWRYREEDPTATGDLIRRLNIPPILARILSARGFRDHERAYVFLNPTLRSLHDPFLMLDMEKGVERLSRAVEGQERMMIHGDYDADGITSTALLLRALGYREGNKLLVYHLPSRFGEGYGLSGAAVERAGELGCTLIVTVDCGITAVEEAEHCRELGIDLIITDHHEPKEMLPPALAVIDPKRAGDPYPFKELAGVGVAFKLLTGMVEKGHLKVDIRSYLDLVAIGTLADVVPLVDENRSLVHEGVRRLTETTNPGLLSLMREMKLDPSKGIGSGDISFRIAPRINSAGRMHHPDLALQLMITDERIDADTFARGLNSMNFRRRAIGAKVQEEVMRMLEETGRIEDPVLVCADPGWEIGVLGIAANRVLDLVGRPCFVLTIEGGVAKGSGRGPEGFDLLGALENCKGLLEEYGGHEKAVGITIREEHLEEFRRRLTDHALREYPTLEFQPRLDIDLDLPLADLSMEQVESLDRMAPFGLENPAPIFTTRNVLLDDIKSVGDGRHLKFRARGEQVIVDCIWFGMGELASVLSPGSTASIAGNADIHEWGGMRDIQLKVIDMLIEE